MKILFVGNANSFLLQNLAKQLKQFNGSFQIDILADQRPLEIDHGFDNVYYADSTSKYAKIKYVKVVYYANQYRKLLDKISNDYDAIHIFYVSSIYRLIWKKLNRKAKRVIVTVFGSDFYKSNSIIRGMISKIVKDCDLITGSNAKTLDDFCEHFNVATFKQRICRFGLTVLDELDNVTEEECLRFREKYGIPKGIKIIACGYNASPNQNYDQVLRSIQEIKSNLKEVFLFFQFHNVQNAYTSEIRKKIKELNIPFHIFDERFSDHELAIYRKTVDIFIQLQKTDQFSGAMQEQLYAGSLVITGKWLPYAQLDEKGMDYVRIEDFNDLNKAILSNIDKKPEKIKNADIIAGFSKWNKTIRSWADLYL